MRYIDADKLIEEIKERIKAAIEWGKSAETEEIKIRAEQSIATFCEASLTAKKLSTADVLEGWKISGEMILATVPSVDVVEVVRCKDCRHFRDRKLKLLDDIYECELTGLVTKPDNYCNYGEGV